MTLRIVNAGFRARCANIGWGLVEVDAREQDWTRRATHATAVGMSYDMGRHGPRSARTDDPSAEDVRAILG